MGHFHCYLYVKLPEGTTQLQSNTHVNCHLCFDFVVAALRSSWQQNPCHRGLTYLTDLFLVEAMRKSSCSLKTTRIVEAPGNWMVRGAVDSWFAGSAIFAVASVGSPGWGASTLKSGLRWTTSSGESVSWWLHLFGVSEGFFGPLRLRSWKTWASGRRVAINWIQRVAKFWRLSDGGGVMDVIGLY